MFTISQLLTDYFRCPDMGVEFDWPDGNGSPEGFFRFGEDTVCYGHLGNIPSAQTFSAPFHDVLGDVHFGASHCVLPFDPAEAVSNFRHERYVASSLSNGRVQNFNGLVRRAYYGARPLLPVSVRKHFQRLFLRGRTRIPFPAWPVDRTVDRIFEKLLAISMKAKGLECLPFIWFWPDGHSSAAIMTHDVETAAGIRFCSTLMDIDEQYGLRSSFQFVPEDRYVTPQSLLLEIRRRGFEVNIHDLNHDGRLYWAREEFLRRAAKINCYGRTFRANGFRAGALYRNLEWYDALDFRYDMSVPNVGHLDPQTGGCCTLFPYFVGQILEVPVTTTQDYSLFQILRDYSIGLWIRQINQILDGHGLISFIAHPDYLVEHHARTIYCSLLGYLAHLCSETSIWTALPGEVNDWWRARNRMRLVPHNGAWRVEGQGKERARIAYACADGGRVCFKVDTGVQTHRRIVTQTGHGNLRASA